MKVASSTRRTAQALSWPIGARCRVPASIWSRSNAVLRVSLTAQWSDHDTKGHLRRCQRRTSSTEREPSLAGSQTVGSLLGSSSCISCCHVVKRSCCWRRRDLLGATAGPDRRDQPNQLAPRPILLIATCTSGHSVLDFCKDLRSSHQLSRRKL